LIDEATSTLSKMKFPTGMVVASGLGWILSAYAVYVEYKVHMREQLPVGDDGEEFVALCDIAAIGASCSNVFTLPVGRMLSYFGLVRENSLLDLPNAGLGVLYYSFMVQSLMFSTQRKNWLSNLLVAGAMASSIFLAYQLTFVIYELCILCWSTHAINTFLFYRHFFGSENVTSDRKDKTL
jgi:vitamin-K-epoxide reductase (warfarin-sensitive)